MNCWIDCRANESSERQGRIQMALPKMTPSRLHPTQASGI